jgi:hypothetical protein
MPDWKRAIRERLDAAGQIVDDDIVDELSQHADAAYEAARAEGRPAEEVAQDVDALVVGWCSHAHALRRRPPRPAAVESPSSDETFWRRTVLHDARYGFRL